MVSASELVYPTLKPRGGYPLPLLISRASHGQSWKKSQCYLRRRERRDRERERGEAESLHTVFTSKWQLLVVVRYSLLQGDTLTLLSSSLYHLPLAFENSFLVELNLTCSKSCLYVQNLVADSSLSNSMLSSPFEVNSAH